MPGPLETLLWLLSFVLQLSVVVFSGVRRSWGRYYTLVIYMAANAVVNALQYYVLRNFGFESITYRYFYYYSETLLVILLFFAIITLCQHAMQELQVSRYVRGGAALLLLATAGFSYMVIHRYNDHLTDRFVVQLGQNLYFVGVVLTYLLWGVVMQLKESRLRILQFVFSLGINFSALAATYALRNLFPSMASTLALIPQIASVFLAASWLYTFARVSEEQRLATARIAVGAGAGH
jgi:hypothetical protein